MTLTRHQREALEHLAKGVQTYQGLLGVGRGSWERMMLKLCDAGFAERHKHGGYQITEQGGLEVAVCSRLKIKTVYAPGGSSIRPYLVYLYDSLLRSATGSGRRFKTKLQAYNAALDEMDSHVERMRRSKK